MKKNLCLLPFLVVLLLVACREQQPAPDMSEAEKVTEDNEPGSIVHLNAEQQKLAGLQFEMVQVRPLQETITIPGRVEFDERRLAHLTARVPGRVENTYAFLGDRVEKNALLATIYSQDFVAAQAEFIQTEERLRLATGRGDSSEIYTARSIFESTRRKLMVMGATEEEIMKLASTHAPEMLLAIRAPFAGTVIETNDILGHFVETGATLFHLIDISRVWVLADVYEKDLAKIEAGLVVGIDVPAYPSETFHGRLTTVFDVLDETSRTLKVRIEVENSSGRLKPKMFATVTMQSRQTDDLLAVPEVAVQTEGDQRFVFVPQSDSSYVKRPVQTGQKIDGLVVITEGLAAGEKIVTAGSFVLKSELLKSTMEGE